MEHRQPQSPSTTTITTNNNPTKKKKTTKKLRNLFRLGRGRKSKHGSSSSLGNHPHHGGYNDDAVSAPPTLTVWHETQSYAAATPPQRSLSSSQQRQSSTTTTSPRSTGGSSNTTTPTTVARADVERQWLFRNRRFQRTCDAVFDAIDTDGSGSVDEKELYAGLLLIHLKLGAYAGPAACRPLGRERVHAVFVDMDADGSGTLDKREFRSVMAFLFANVLTRVIVQWSMTLLIVPLVAQSILDGIYATAHAIYTLITTLDEKMWIADQIEVSLETLWAWAVAQLPDVVLRLAARMASLLEKVPESVWNSIPLTLLSTVLGIAVVPYIIYSIDEYFQKAAKSHADKEVGSTIQTKKTRKTE